MLGLSSSGLLAQSSIVHHPQVPASWNNQYSANPLHVGLGIQGGCLRIGTADNPVTVTEYVTFLNSQHFRGVKQLIYPESLDPLRYAGITSDKDYDPAYDEILMEGFSLFSSFCVNTRYFYRINPKNQQKFEIWPIALTTGEHLRPQPTNEMMR